MAIPGCTSVALSGGVATCTTSFDAVNGASHSIVGTYSGSSSFNGSNGSTTQGVTKGATGTVTTLTSGTNPTPTGASVTYTATVSPTSPAAGNPTGTVSFTSDASPISGCTAVPLVSEVATCTTASSAANGASHSIVATYSGDTSFLTSTAAGYTQTVNKGRHLDGGHRLLQQPVGHRPERDFHRHHPGGQPGTGTTTGTVDFTSDGNSIGCDSQPVSGTTATCTTTYDAAAGGSHTIVATYSGDTNFDGPPRPTSPRR